MTPYTTTKTIAILIGLMCVPVALSVLYFSSQSLRLDEAQSLWQSSRDAGSILTLIAKDVHVPLYHELLHFWRIAFGDTITTARLMSLLFYVLSIPLLYLLGKRAFDRTTGIFAAFMFSISPFMNWYGNEIRMYTLFTFFVILNQYFFIRILKADPEASPRAWDNLWAGYVITSVLGVFSHYFFFLNLASQVVFYLLQYRSFPSGSLKRFIAAAAIVLFSFLPWAWYVYHLGEAGNQDPLLIAPTSINLFNTVSQFLFGFQNDNLNTLLLSLWPITIIFAFLALRKQRVGTALETQYFLITLLVSVAITFVGSFIVAPIFVSRYLIFTVPSLYLLLASLFRSYAPKVASLARFTLAGLMILMLAFEVTSPTTPVKENYETASKYLSTHATAQDVIILSAPFTVYPVGYYYRGPATIVTLPLWDQYAYGPIPPFNEEELPQQVELATGKSQNVYLLLSYDQGYEKQIKDYFDNHFERLATEQFSDDLNVYVYKLRYDTPLSRASGKNI